MPRVFIPPPLRSLTGGEAEVRLEGTNVRRLIESMEERYPGMKARLVEHGELAAGIAVIIDGVTAPRSLVTPLREESEVHFLPAIAGG